MDADTSIYFDLTEAEQLAICRSLATTRFSKTGSAKFSEDEVTELLSWASSIRLRHGLLQSVIEGELFVDIRAGEEPRLIHPRWILGENRN